jgi:DNA polymerase III delta subunit
VPGRLTAAAARQQIASGRLEPLYLVTGNDDVAMTDLASAIADSVEEDFRAFNVQRFYGSDGGTKMAEVLDAASTLPLLSPRRVVILLQAERVLVSRKARAGEAEADAGTAGGGSAEEGGAKRQLALLKEYAGHPHAHASVVIVGSGLARSFEPMAKQAALVVCEASYDVIASLSAQHGVRFDRAAVELLKQRAGGIQELDSGRLRDDVERVILYAAGRQVITRDLVAEVVGRPAAAGGWALSNAVENGNAAAALGELRLRLAEGAVPFMLLGMLRSTVERKIAAPGLPAAMDALMRTDLALKTSAGDARVLLERLIVELCGAARGRG